MKFASTVDNCVDFNGGTLNLRGDWDFDSLAAIDHSDFRVFGVPATEDDLRFEWVLIGSDVYTQVTAIPEPSTLVLFCMGAVDLLA